MTDEALEQLLGRQRVAGPSPLLRARMLAAATGEPRRVRLGMFDYATAALAAGLVLAAWVIKQPEMPAPSEASRQREITALAETLGGGPVAFQYAELVVLRDDEPTDPALVEASW